MHNLQENISSAVVRLPAPALERMHALVGVADRLSGNRLYRDLVYPQVPAIARHDPGHAAAMMCYDFHLVEEIPRLIEVNTNAGGGLLACMACDPSMSAENPVVPDKLKARLLQMFADEMAAFTSGRLGKPERIVIIDENPSGQYLYPEMEAFAGLFRAWGVDTAIVEPGELEASKTGVFLQGRPVDMIYNRHCDFYLASEVMAGVKDAYLNQAVCLTPNPHMYGLLADKRRLALWADTAKVQQWQLPADDVAVLSLVVPQASLLAEHDPELLWPERKNFAFKPVDSFGSRGVLMGEKISRKRFDELPSHQTLVQQLVPPSMTEVPDYGPMKTDFRLFAYRDIPLGITARLYRGQVTNLRTPGGGFARVDIV